MKKIYKKFIWFFVFIFFSPHPSPLPAGRGARGQPTPHPSPLPAMRGEGIRPRIFLVFCINGIFVPLLRMASPLTRPPGLSDGTECLF